ncbi:hypothetical protein NBH00_07845 [Paraconexibacter antarcticus]|uniref:Uncharacterized protein n=1 Tax=Paraconexibacter antarcticus TaxID=2949664 RepID=A0ABY5DY69_9ACTN|nr:hypothetical protein [Paraconexibacter antarcticus]UTI66106.1 hypothetical protein NBH00_07845 [Paraconexibacter antarcticus]
MTPSPTSSLWMPRSRCPASAAQTASGTLPTPSWIVAPSGMRSTTAAAIAWSRASDARCSGSASGRSTAYQPTQSARRMRCAPAVRGICAFTSTKNGTRPMSAAL